VRRPCDRGHEVAARVDPTGPSSSSRACAPRSPRPQWTQRKLEDARSAIKEHRTASSRAHRIERLAGRACCASLAGSAYKVPSTIIRQANLRECAALRCSVCSAVRSSQLCVLRVIWPSTWHPGPFRYASCPGHHMTPHAVEYHWSKYWTLGFGSAISESGLCTNVGVF